MDPALLRPIDDLVGGDFQLSREIRSPPFVNLQYLIAEEFANKP